MKTSSVTVTQFWEYLKSVPDNTFFLCINHKYDYEKRYIIYNNNNNYECFEKFFDTNSKEELKMWIDLIGYNILRIFLIKNYSRCKFEIKYAMIELSKVS